MNNYAEKVDKLVGVLLQAEENYERIELILDSDLAYDVAVTLQDEVGKEFFYESKEDDFDYLLKNNDILGITIARYGNKLTYFLQEVTYKGVTLEEEMDKYFIQDYLIDCLDLDRLHGNKYILKEFDDSESEQEECNGDCANCTLHDDDEEYEREIEEEDIVEILFKELLASIDEVEFDNDLVDNIYDLIKEKLEEAIEIAYEEGFDDCLKEVKESIDCI